MGVGLVVYDVLFVLVASALYGGAAFAGVRAYGALAPLVPSHLATLAAFPAFFAALAVLVLEVSALSALCPRLRPGRYEMMKGAVFYGWIFRSLLRRVLFVPGVRWFVLSSNVLRFVALRGLGARVAFTTNMSVDADILDPSLFEAGPGATIGARCLVSGHYVEGGKLVLGDVRVGAGSLLAVEVLVAPDVVIGERVMIKGRASLSVGVRVGDGASVGPECLVDTGASVGARARLGSRVHVKPKSVVADGEKLSA